MTTTLITLDKVNKYFNNDSKNLHVLKDVSFKVNKGEFLMLLGPSGSGKSTLLRILAGLDTPTSGQVTQDVKMTQSFIFQDFALFPWLNVEDNVGFGLKMQGFPKNERKRIVAHHIKEMGLSGFEKNFPRELSGGMKQRVGIARALAVNPEIIFLDEPFSALDSFTAKKLRDELLSIYQKHKITIVMVTHLVEEAVLLANRIVVLSQRPAEVAATISNKLKYPRNNRSQDFYKLEDKISKSITV